MRFDHRVLACAGLALLLAPGVARASDAPNERSRVSPGAIGSGACDLVTRTEAAKAYGATVPPATEKLMDVPIAGGGSIKALYCLYGSEVVLARLALGNGGRSFFGQYRKSLETRSDFREVSGVGDEAFAAKGQLNVRRGNTGILVDVTQARGASRSEFAAEKSLAALALARL